MSDYVFLYHQNAVDQRFLNKDPNIAGFLSD